MIEVIPINIVVEDHLSEIVVRKLLDWSGRSYTIGITLNRGGKGYIKKNIKGFNNASQGTPFFVLTDLDMFDCAPALITQWLPVKQNPNLIFRIAVKEVEAWLLGDRVGLAKFLKISYDDIPQDVEKIQDPKQFIISLARKSKSSEIRKDIVPSSKSLRVQGPNYNGRLSEFVINFWDPDQASSLSDSLMRTKDILLTFNPSWKKRKMIL